MHHELLLFKTWSGKSGFLADAKIEDFNLKKNHFHVTGPCDKKKRVYIGAIEQYEHGVSGDIYACGDNQLVIEKFTYDGLHILVLDRPW